MVLIFYSTCSLHQGRLRAKFFTMSSLQWWVFFQSTIQWFSKSDIVTIQCGDGPTTYMVISLTKQTNGRIWWFCMSPRSLSDLQCWKHHWLISTKASCLHRFCVDYRYKIWWLNSEMSLGQKSINLQNKNDQKRSSSHGHHHSGKPGCRNVKAGGDTIGVPCDSLGEGQSRCSTYVVYRSFKYPPPVKPYEPIRVKSTSTCKKERIRQINYWCLCEITQAQSGLHYASSWKTHLPWIAFVYW